MAAFSENRFDRLRHLIRSLVFHLPPWYARYRSSLEVIARYQEMLLTRSDSQSGRNVLIAAPHFWPSVGGLEHRMEQFGGELVRAGYRVTVITPEFPGREGDSHNGVRIFSVNPGIKVDGLPAWPYLVRKSVLSGHFDVCLLIQDPLGELLWSAEQLVPPPDTRLIIQPIINAEGYAKWCEDTGFSGRLAALLKSASVAVAMTRSGPDTQFMTSAGISHVYIPNASAVPEAEAGFRRRHGIPDSSFVVLHVANLWWIKNHIGLLDVLNRLPDRFKLVLVGSPTAEKECARAVLDRLSQRPEVLFIPGLNRNEVSSAMAEADVIVLSSCGEGSPNTILEAMAHAKPWLATPQCGAANDNAGGIISPLAEFMDYLTVLQQNPELGRRLGALGQRHWQSCFSWDRVAHGWMELFEQGQLKEDFAMPCEVADEKARLGSLIAEAIETTHLTGKRCSLKSPGEAGVFVNIGMITYNRLEFTKQALAALQMVAPGCPFVLTVIDNASSDGTREYLKELRRGGVIKNLVLLDENVGVAKASNLAWSLEPEAGCYLKMDNDIVIRKPGWLRDMVNIVDCVAEAGAVAYNFEPKSYSAVMLHGSRVRPKLNGNLGGACILIPRRTHELLGYWCEDYGLYGEEDADFGVRVKCASLLNLYMEDEEVGFHLPSGRAARIGFGFRAKDGIEEVSHAGYRVWKDRTRRKNIWFGPFKSNLSGYTSGKRGLFLRSIFVEAWKERYFPDVVAHGQETVLTRGGGNDICE